MLIFLNNDGTAQKVVPQHVYQGTAGQNNIQVIAPYDNQTALAIAFALPNRTSTNYLPMSYDGTNQPWANQGLFVWTYSIPFAVTEISGVVQVAINAVSTNGNQTSYLTTFTVEESVLPVPPAAPDDDTWEQMLVLYQNNALNIGAVQTILSGGTLGQFLQSQGNGTPVWASFDGVYVSFMNEQTLTAEQQAQARANINAQKTLVVGENLDSTPTADSTYPVTSDGVKTELDTLDSSMAARIDNNCVQFSGGQALTADEQEQARANIDVYSINEIDESCVKFSGAQVLTEAEKAQARDNIGADGTADNQYNVKVVEQSFAEAEKAQARTNIASQKALTVGENLDSTPIRNSTNPVTSGGVHTALETKQDTLTVGENLDSTPTANSTNPVTSGGVKTALDGKQDTIGVLPVANGGTGNSSVDAAPTRGSTKMVTSGGVKAAIVAASDKTYQHTETFRLQSAAGYRMDGIDIWNYDYLFEIKLRSTISDNAVLMWLDTSAHTALSGSTLQCYSGSRNGTVKSTLDNKQGCVIYCAKMMSTTNNCVNHIRVTNQPWNNRYVILFEGTLNSYDSASLYYNQHTSGMVKINNNNSWQSVYFADGDGGLLTGTIKVFITRKGE